MPDDRKPVLTDAARKEMLTRMFTGKNPEMMANSPLFSILSRAMTGSSPSLAKRFNKTAAAAARQKPAPTTPAAQPKRTYTPAPAGYRPGIDAEHNYSQPVKMAKGGKVNRGDGCCVKGHTKGKKK